MRSTIHIVSPRDYWSFAAALGPSRQEWWLRTWGRHESAANVDFAARELETALAGRAWHRTEIDALLPEKSATVWSGIWIPLVRVPPSGTWERRRADLFRLAAEWLPAEQVTEDEGLEHLLRRYLSAFGPSTLADAASWAGVKRATLLPVAERIPTSDLPRRGRQGAPRPPPCASPAGGHPCADPLPRPLGRRPPRARAPHADPARAVPAARVLHEDAPVDGDVPRGRLRRRRLGGSSARRRRQRFGSSRSSPSPAPPARSCEQRARASCASTSRTRSATAYG